MQKTILSLVVGISLAGGVRAGETPYNPGGNGQKTALKYEYFCHSDSADGKLYLTKPKFAFQGNYDQKLVANIDVAWADYMNKTYDRRIVRYPHCEFITDAQVDRTIKSFITNASTLHRQVINVDWQFAPSSASPGGPSDGRA